MTMLPDVPQDVYRQYQADQFGQDADNQINSLGFEQAANARIASLEPSVPPPAAPLPAPAAPVTAPLVAPPQLQAPPAAPVDPNLFAAALTAAQQAGANVQQFAQNLGQRLGQPAQQGQDLFSHALGAVESSGGDFQTFAQNFSAAPPPAPPPAAPPQVPLAPPPAQPVGVGKQAFIQSLAGDAQQVAAESGLPASVLLAIPANETGWGSSIAGGNLYGIKGTNPLTGANTGPVATQEVYGGQRQNIQDTFRAYTDPLASMRDFASFLRDNPRYAPALQQYARDGDADHLVQNIHAAGYATDPTWATKVNSIAHDVQGTLGDLQAKGQLAGPLQTASQVSQFGDQQLTTAEAYAACGPAAAVRFANAYGRNPTLREATDLAKTVGWTQAQGMAGISSEKALMDKLGVPTRIVGPDVQSMATEASTGNPVTISTPGHYFYADGYDPNSGAFHVGQSGLDLKGGKEWMTTAQMSALMGPIQGALLADNPQVPAPSTADQGSNPLDFLGRARDALSSGLSQVQQAGQQAVQQVQHAASNLLPAVPAAAAPTPTPSDQLTNPLGTGNLPAVPAVPAVPLSPSAPVTAPLAVPPPAAAPPQPQISGPLDALGQAAQGVQQAVQDTVSAVQQVPQQASSAASSALQGLQQAATNLQQSVAALPQQAVSNLIGAYTGAPNAGGLDLTQPLVPGGQSALGATLQQAVQSLPDISDTLVAPPPNTPLGKVVAGTPIGSLSPTEQAQALMQWNQQYSQASEQATQRINPLRDFPVLGGLINQSTNPEFWLTLAGAGGLGGAAEGLAAPGSLAGALARGGAEGALFNAVGAAQQPSATAQDVALNALLGGVLGTGISGGLRGLGQLGSLMRQGLPDLSPEGLASLVSRTGTDLRPGLAGPGELGTLSPRTELPNYQLWESTPGARYVGGNESGYHLPPLGQAAITPETQGLPAQQQIRQAWADMQVNPRFPRDLQDPQANAFADAMRANGASVAQGEWTPEQTALSALLTRYSQGRGLTQAAGLSEGLGDEWMLRNAPSLQTQGAVPGGRPTAYGLTIRPETLAAHIAGDPANPSMMEFLTALSRPALDQLPAGTDPAAASFATTAERQAAIQRGADAFYQLTAQAGQGGDRGDRALITGGPIVRTLDKGTPAEQIQTSYAAAPGAKGRQAWADMLPALHQTIQDWGTQSGKYAGLDPAATKAQLLQDLQNARVAGIGLDKAPFVANMGFSPEYGILDLRMRRQGFGLSPKATLTRAERDLGEQKLAEAFPNANSNYVAQWLPWAYMTDEKTDYTSIASAYQKVGDFMRQAEQTAQATGRPLGDVVGSLSAQQPRVATDYPITAQDVTTRIGVSPQVIKTLAPGTSGEALRKAVPELEAFRKQAGVTWVEKPSVGTGLGIGPDGKPVTEPDANLVVQGSQAANRYFGAAWLAANPAEDSVMLAHTGPAMANAGDSLATIRLKGGALDASRLHQLLSEFSPDGWHTTVKLNREGGQVTSHAVIGGVAQTAADFSGRVQDFVNTLERNGIRVASHRVEPAQIEFLGQQDVPEVLYGGPRGAVGQAAPGVSGLEGEVGRGGPGLGAGGARQAPSIGRALGGALDTLGPAGPNAPAVRDATGQILPGDFTTGLGRRVAGGAVQGGVAGGYQASQQPGATPQDVALGALQGAGLGAARGVLPISRLPVGVLARAAAEEAGKAAPAAGSALERLRAGFEAPPPDPVGLGDRLSAAWTAVDRQLTDRGVDLANLQQEYAKAIGRPLNANEMVHELSRRMSDPAAQVRVDQGLGPAIRSVGQDYEPLRDLVTARSSVQVADQVGQNLMQDLADKQVPAPLREAAAAADTSLRMRQNTLNALLESDTSDPARVAAAQRSVAAAQRTLDTRQAAIEAQRQVLLQNASSQGAEAAAARMFSGGVNRADSLQAIQDLQDQLGPERFKKVSDAADQVSQFGQSLRQRLVDSGVLSQEQADQMQARYPDWVKTRILDYMDKTQGGQSAGSNIGLGSRDVHAYTQAGTERSREDPLASMVAYAHQVERMAMKNETANALLNVDQASPTPSLRKLVSPEQYAQLEQGGADMSRYATGSPTNTQQTLNAFVNGEKQSYITDNPAVAQAINTAHTTSLPSWLSGWNNFFRAVAASRNPVFVAGHASFTLPAYILRQTALEGGSPQAFVRTMGALASSFGDVFDGLLQGRPLSQAGPETQKLLLGGGGQFGALSSSSTDAAKAVQAMRGIPINSAAGALGLIKDLATLKPVENVINRVDYWPRVAAMQLAKQRGEAPIQQIIAGRDATIDFNRGGQATKVLSQIVPFLNVGFQGPAQVARTFGQNKAGFIKSTGMLIGMPTVATELWNHADPQRAKDYADVPQYIKDQGLVIMLPGEAPLDAQGNRQPQFAWVNLRNWAPMAVMARNAVDAAMGYDHQNLAEAGASMLSGASPVSASSGAPDLMSKITAGVPLLPAAAQLAINKDLFRNRNIVSDRADQNASQLAKDLTPDIQAVVDRLGRSDTVRPSAVDFLIRDQLAGTGGALLSGYDMARGKPPSGAAAAGPQQIPLAGAVIGRFVRGQGGELLQQAQQTRLTPSAAQALRAGGVNLQPSPMPSIIDKVPLQRDEETQLQTLANRYVDTELQNLVRSPAWQTANPTTRDQMAKDAESVGRGRATAEVMRSIPPPERSRRIAQKAAAA